ncbi:MAG: LptF/LptG family permease [Candidatus Eremiobacteraeota bacterium]|nr:LptF/LptG family permease [Candidatus Eremiobacteraeota bacterium]MBC5826255.1 LptF/LptG family permease [Candidatus Eremiobacteraeota bacterium]
MLIELEGAAPAERLDWLSAGHGRRQWPRRSARSKTSGLSILDGYLIREMAAPFGFAIAAFTLFLVINSFFLAADYIINKGVPFSLVLRYIVLELPAFIYLILPFAALFGVLLGFGRLAGDNEVTAMRTSGIGLNRIALPCYVAGIVLTLLAFSINESIAPRAYHKATEVFRQIAYHSTQPIIPPDRFIKVDGQHVIFIGSVNPVNGTMTNVQIFTLGPGYYPDSLTATTGRQRGGKIVLYNGVWSQYGKDGLVTRQQHFDTLGFPLGDPTVLYQGDLSAYEMNSTQLRAELRALKGSGQDTRDDEMKLQQKFAMPLACLVGILIALPLSVRFGKNGRGVAAMLAVVVMFAYYLVMAATTALGKNGALPAVVAAWIPNLSIGFAGLALLVKEER